MWPTCCYGALYLSLYSELLDHLNTELLQCPHELTITINHPHRDVVMARELLSSLFEGQLTSSVRRGVEERVVVGVFF